MKAAYQNMAPSDAGLPDTDEGKYSDSIIELGSEHVLQTSVANTEIPLSRPEDRMTFEKVDLTYASGFLPGETNPLPDRLERDDHDNQFLIEQWTLFRLFPIMIEFFSSFDRIFAQMRNIPDSGRKLSTLMRYYNLLPEFARSNPVVRNVVRGLEFTKHNIPLHEKELWLNYVCQFTLPREECNYCYCLSVNFLGYEKALSQALISQTYFVPLWEEIQLLDEDEGVIRTLITIN